MIIDEFACDRIEREESPQSAHLLYKIIAPRNQKSSTALATNVDVEKWGDYLPDGPVAMAFLDRIVEGAIILKIQGRSYRAHGPKEVRLEPGRERFLNLVALAIARGVEAAGAGPQCGRAESAVRVTLEHGVEEVGCSAVLRQ